MHFLVQAQELFDLRLRLLMDVQFERGMLP
jgi:hypothetical protein